MIDQRLKLGETVFSSRSYWQSLILTKLVQTVLAATQHKLTCILVPQGPENASWCGAIGI